MLSTLCFGTHYLDLIARMNKTLRNAKINLLEHSEASSNVENSMLAIIVLFYIEEWRGHRVYAFVEFFMLK